MFLYYIYNSDEIEKFIKFELVVIGPIRRYRSNFGELTDGSKSNQEAAEIEEFEAEG
jgi:hypothetical protein